MQEICKEQGGAIKTPQPQKQRIALNWAPNRCPGRIVHGHTETALKRVVDGLKQEVEHEILCIIFV